MALGTQPTKPAFRERRIERAKDGRIVIIRPARISDAAEITRRMARVVKEGIYLEEEPDTLPTGREQEKEIQKIREDGGLYAVVEVDGKIAGVALLRRGPLEMNRHVAKFRMWLVPGYRGLGLGKKLMEYVVDGARARGVEKISLDVFSNNERAIGLYKKFGFRVEGRLKGQYVLEGRYVDEILMGLSLQDQAR
ncbi:GNAT family N-acetyltransferase [Planifilum fimeticola]